MRALASIAQGAWALGNLPAAMSFATALRDPENAQWQWLSRRIKADAESGFGREHDFGRIRSYHDFAKLVPLGNHADFAGWIESVRLGRKHVLTMEEVTHLAPTSGSSGARKLIPFTATLHASFARAVGAWMTDLTRLEPRILGGAAYWSVSPLVEDDTHEPGTVRVGFAEDAEYLGAWRAWVAGLAMAVPAELRHERNLGRFWLRTATHLLARRDLRLISVWHPSFLERILETTAEHWRELLGVLPKSRADELERVGPARPAGWWPALRVISAWGDLAAEPGLRHIARRFPNCLVQAKGLLATEAVVSIPWQGGTPLAVTSHFFEFLTEDGEIHRAHELRKGNVYEVVVSNGGGLWRYRLGDLVECTGHMGSAPTLRFLGRVGNVCDLRGEKISEAFVAAVLAELWPEALQRPACAHLQPFDDRSGAGYALVSSQPVEPEVLAALDLALRSNPHYDLARKLGQLREPRFRLLPPEDGLVRAGETRRLGDIKPLVLAGLATAATGEE